MKKLVLILLAILSSTSIYASADSTSTSAVTYITFKGRGNSSAFLKEVLTNENASGKTIEAVPAYTNEEEVLSIPANEDVMEMASSEASGFQKEIGRNEKGKMRKLLAARKALKKLKKGHNDPDTGEFIADLLGWLLVALLLAGLIIGLVIAGVVALVAISGNPLLIILGLLVLVGIGSCIE